MSVIICTIIGLLVGVVSGALLFGSRERRTLPPATGRQRARASRANRADIRHLVITTDLPAVSLDDFDDSDTHP